MNYDDDEPPELIDVPNENNKIIPITVLSGFLGSGKTTLLNYILKHAHGQKIAVIENEFSAGLGIEGMIAKSGIDGQNIEGGFFELNNGCICCSSKGDLIGTLENLLLHKDKFDYILIETTGLANPGPVIASLWSDDDINTSLKLDGVVTLVDSVNIAKYMSRDDISNDVGIQIAYADRVLLNKIDIATPAQIEEARQLIRSVNAAVQIYETSYANISGIGDGLSIILHLDSLNVGYGSSQRAVKNAKNTESAESKASSGSIADEGESSAETVAAHSIISNFDRMASDGSSVYISCVPCNPNTNFSADENSEAESENKTVFSNFKNPTVVALRNNGLVKIENNFKKVKVSNGNGASQHAALKMTSAGIEMAGTFDLQKLKLFVDELIYHNGVESNALDNNAANTLGNENGEHVSNANKKMEIIRMKGVFKCTNDVIAHDVDHLYILQSICDIFEIQRSSIVCGSADDKTNNVNKFIIIGQNVDVDTVTKSLAACLV